MQNNTKVLEAYLGQ
ncbi:hypothetical protein IQ226_14045 [Dolichospermum sp. LEGE 00240]|uniref:Uncharacterized protein n=1 Tax=Dolichospermum flos-aquae UHCC 0037 TaxID=2590026 RepID=A0ACC7S6F2_DOLFA|nr:hypothetical protein [Dolichospermum sp. LEGE 00240]MBO1065625.1 hypothetical protein [Anabaena sp. 54]MTJ43949.1 hypothetical protein [Dolichospermum flos-aquae UHCC 0037]